MDDYKKYLAEQILSEDKLVTYRALSRALKVNVNLAKQMLYDFHKSQNDRRPGAIYATYLVYGIKKSVEATNGHVREDGDVEMTSSMPEAESVAEEITTHTLTLVSEEQLKDVLSQYEQVTSIHVYSLGPHPLKDLQLLSDAARPLVDAASTDNSVDSGTTYGTITNPCVRRRERKGTTAPPVAQTISKQQETKPTLSKPAPFTKVKEEPKEVPSKPSASAAAPAKKPVPALKRGGSSGIMQAFGKAAAKPKKTDSQPATPVTADADTSMQAMSDDGEDDSEVVPKPKTEDSGPKQSRKEREEALRRMMDDEDEEEEPEEKADSPMEEPVEEPPAPEPEKEAEPTEVVSSTGDGRRRGKRRIMRKKQILDDQGYLVTIQEPGWESFSEDETPQPPKKKVETSAPAAQPMKAKKSGPKGAQGNIMSFFSKK